MNRNSKLPRANHQITAPQVRLIDSQGDMIGVVSLSEALNRASKVSLDLVEISADAEPPVCKIIDFGKFKYESKKKKQESQKKQKTVSSKEIKFRPNIGQGDFDVKMKNIRKFITDGSKVRVSLWFRGREIVHNDIGMQLFQKIIANSEDIARIEVEPKLEGKQMFMLIVPK